MGDFCRILDLIRQALDYRSNPTTINGSQTTYTTCTYDANGERLMRYNQTHYYYYYDGVNLLFVKKDNAIDMRYLYDNEGNVYCAIANDGLPYWHHTDIRGSVTNVLKGDSGTSSSPTLIRSYLYNAYGDTNYTTFSGGETFNANPYLAYTGAILDQETGLYYLMSRYYDPKAGSFISQDSYKGEGDAFWHLYAYCDGDPVNKTDRNGRYGLWYPGYNKIKKYAKKGVGAANSFAYHKRNYSRANCLGFACGFNENVGSKKLKPLFKRKYGRDMSAYSFGEYNVELWFKATLLYLNNKRIWVRRLSYYTDPIFPNERRIVLRCRKKNYFNKKTAEYSGPDFHFLCQTSNSFWAGKFGETREYHNNINRPTGKWPGDHYDSPIIYFAISKKQYK